MFDICSIVVNTSCRRKHVSVLGRKRLFCSFRAGLKLCSPTSASQVAGTTGPTEFLSYDSKTDSSKKMLMCTFSKFKNYILKIGCANVAQ